MTKFELKPDDFYTDKDGNLVFTESYHLKRGHCCMSGCRHCPFDTKFDPSLPQELQVKNGRSDEENEQIDADKLIEQYSDFMKE